MTKTSDYDYTLPQELIAQKPADRRDGSRMLVLPQDVGSPVDTTFSTFPDYLEAGDCLVINDTRVLPARLFGRRPTGGQIEALLLEAQDETTWRTLLRPGRRMKPGSTVTLTGPDGEPADLSYEVLERCDDHFIIRFNRPATPEVLEAYGSMPLPPYVDRAATAEDTSRYQTVFADEPGAVAAPTAGLHFTDAILDTLREKGVKIVTVTLHVGIGTFRPVDVEDFRDHIMHEERYELSADSADTINDVRRNGGRIAAVGTTAVRTLETCANDDGTVTAGSGRTSIFIHPPKVPKVVDLLLTNFHLPKSTLMMLVASFVGRERLLDAYAFAVKERFRFYSYGDCMLIHKQTTSQNKR